MASFDASFSPVFRSFRTKTFVHTNFMFACFKIPSLSEQYEMLIIDGSQPSYTNKTLKIWYMREEKMRYHSFHVFISQNEKIHIFRIVEWFTP